VDEGGEESRERGGGGRRRLKPWRGGWLLGRMGRSSKTLARRAERRRGARSGGAAAMRFR